MAYGEDGWHHDRYAERDVERGPEHYSKRRRYDSPPSPRRDDGRPPFVAPVTLRLVAKVSSRSPLPPEQTLALCDPATTTSIGRDRSFDTRIRLKELAVSKTHAHLFWLPGDRTSSASWAISDTGSQHGTQVQRIDTAEWQRISEPRTASKPVRIGHLEFAHLPLCHYLAKSHERMSSRIKICSTVFTAHVHQPPCEMCAIASDNSNLIPTTQVPTAPPPAPTTAPTPAAPPVPSALGVTRSDKEEAVKRDFKNLKAHLLAKPNKPAKEVADAPKHVYIDRARIRRSLQASDDAADRLMNGASSRSTVPFPTPMPPPPPPARAAPPSQPPLEDSRGYALLTKLSGPLGSAAEMQRPLAAKTLGERAGLGSRKSVDAHELASERQERGYAAVGQRRRWDEVK